MLTTHEAEILQHLVYAVDLKTNCHDFDKAIKRLKQFGYVIERPREYYVTQAGRRALRAHAKH